MSVEIDRILCKLNEVMPTATWIVFNSFDERDCKISFELTLIPNLSMRNLLDKA